MRHLVLLLIAALTGPLVWASDCDRELIERALMTLEARPVLTRHEVYDELGHPRAEVSLVAARLFGVQLPAKPAVNHPEYRPYLERIARARLESECAVAGRPTSPHEIEITRLKSRHGVTAAFIVRERAPAFRGGIVPAHERWRVIGRDEAAREFVREDLRRMFDPTPPQPTDLSDLITFADGRLTLDHGADEGFVGTGSELVIGATSDLFHLDLDLAVRRGADGRVTVVTCATDVVGQRRVRTFGVSDPAFGTFMDDVFVRMVPRMVDRGVARVLTRDGARLILIDQDADNAYVLHAVRDSLTTAWAAPLETIRPENGGIEIHLSSRAKVEEAITDLLWRATFDPPPAPAP